MSSIPQATHAFGGRTALFSALRYRNYRLYWFGQQFSVLAQNMEYVAESWLVLEITNSPLMLGLTGLTYATPRILLALLGGVIADRADRKRIMIFTQGCTGCLFFILATLVVSGMVSLWQVLVLVFFSGCLRAFDRPSRVALLPQMVPREQMANAVALGSTVWQSNRLIGPSVAGVLIYLTGVGPTLYVCWLGSVIAVFLWLMIRLEPVVPNESKQSLIRHIIDGLNFIRRNQVFYTLMGMTFFNSVFGMSYLVLMPVFARDILHVGSQGYGFLQSGTGAGALGGALLVAYLAGFQKKGWQAVIGAIVFGNLLMGFAFSTSYSLSLGLVFMMGLANQLYLTSISTILQLRLPDELRGRVMGLYGLTWDLMPVGGAISGTIAEYAGAPAAIAMGGFLVAIMALWVAVGLPRVRQLQ